MEAELTAASEELKARKEEEAAQRIKSVKYVCVNFAVSDCIHFHYVHTGDK